MANSNSITGKKQNIIEGGLILSLALLVIKLLGWYFRIALIDIYGETGSGYFSTVFNIYNLIYGLVVTGAPVAISRLISQYTVQNRYRDIRNLEKVALRLFLIAGLAGTLILAVIAVPYAKSLVVEEGGDYRYYIYPILAISPAILFCSLMSVYRGYNQGMKNMIPTAMSQVIEVLVKVAAGIAMATLAKKYFTSELQLHGTVLGIAVEQHSEEFILALSAAGALLGVAISNIAGWLFLALRRAHVGDGIRKAQINASPEPLGNKALLKAIVMTVLPIAISSATVQLSGVIDNQMLSRILGRLFTENRDIVLASHNNIFLDSFADPKFNPPNFLYGIYNAIATVMNLVPTITGSFGMSALPMISSAWTAGNLTEVKKHTETSLRICLMIGAPAGFGLTMLAGPILGIIYKNAPMTAQIGVGILEFMGMVAIVIAIMGIVTAMFQAIGRTTIPLILTAVALTIKIAVNWVMVSIPQYNILVAPLGNLTGFTVFCIAGLIIFIRITKIKINIWGTVMKPLIAGAVTGLIAKYAYQLLHRFIGSNMICTAGSILMAVAGYLVSVLLLRILEKEDILSLPGGKKLSHILEKMHVIR